MTRVVQQFVYEAQISMDETIAVLADSMAEACRLVFDRYGDEPLAIKRQWRDILVGSEE